jgi:hypothetical protein
MPEFAIPYRGEDDLIVEAIDAARETLTGDELRVTEQIVWDALDRGVTKVGDLLAEFESAGATGRRRLRTPIPGCCL